MLAPTLKLKIHLKSYHPFYLDNFILQVRKKLSKIYVFPMKHIFLPQKKKRFTLLRSPHVDKKARDQFEQITYNRLISLKLVLTDNTMLSLYRFIKYVTQLNAGSSIEVCYKIIKN